MAEKKKLTDSEFEILISEVQSRTCLWNDRHSDFKNSVITKKLWEQVGKSLNLSGDECKKKWKNLKDTYRKKVQNPPSKSGSAASPPRKIWKFASLMEFTRDVIIPSPMIGNLESPSLREEEMSTSDVETQEFIGADSNNMLQQDSHTGESSCPEEKNRFSRPHHSMRKVRRKDDMEKRIFELEERKLQAILNIGKEPEKGDDYYFLLSLLPYISRLDDLEKLELRNKIQNCVIEAVKDHETKKMQRNYTTSSYQSSSNSSCTFVFQQANSSHEENPHQPQDTQQNDEFTYLTGLFKEP